MDTKRGARHRPVLPASCSVATGARHQWPRLAACALGTVSGNAAHRYVNGIARDDGGIDWRHDPMEIAAMPLIDVEMRERT